MKLEVFETEPTSNAWQGQVLPVAQFLKLSAATRAQIVFISSRTLVKDPNLCNEFREYLKLPKCIFEEQCQRSNGFIGHNITRDSDGAIQSFESWFRFESKRLEPEKDGAALVKPEQRYKKYDWDDIGFFIRVDSGPLLVVGFDVPSELQSRLLQHPSASNHSPHLVQAGQFLNVILQEVVIWYDQAVWRVRDAIRVIEKARSHQQLWDADFAALHDSARHAIHTTEVVGVALHTAGQLLDDIRHLSPNAAAVQSDSLSPAEFWVNFLRSTLSRAQAVEKRFANEINLAFNLVTQRDSSVMKQISFATRKDSEAMKYIAVVTLAFLPATFVSTIFSMSFFTLSKDDATGQTQWIVSSKFWIYWVIAVPLTLLTLVVWGKGRRISFDA